MITWRVEWIFADVDDAHFTDHRSATVCNIVVLVIRVSLHWSQICSCCCVLCNIIVLVIRVCEDTPLKVLLDKYLHPTDSDPVIRHRYMPIMLK